MRRLVLAVVAACLAVLHLYLYRQAPAELAASLAVDLALVVVDRFPRGVALLALGVAVRRAIADLAAPGMLTAIHAPTLATVPTATPVIVWFVVHTLPRRPALLITAAFTVLAARPWAPAWGLIYSGLSATALPALLGLYVRARQELLRSLRDRAESAEREQRLLVERTEIAEREQRLLAERTEREQRALAERAKADERQRLATEMHDLVTHHVTEIVLHAGALKVSTRDDHVRGAAERIRQAGADTLNELRDLIGILKSAGDPYEPAPRDPIPSYGPTGADLRRLDEDATLHITGEPGPVPPAVARAAYRVVQEALTNARKHAPEAPVRIAVDYGPHSMTIEVENERSTVRPDPALAGSGTGLDGLRRRVTLLGGAFDAAPTGSGGFRLSARLPT